MQQQTRPDAALTQAFDFLIHQQVVSDFSHKSSKCHKSVNFTEIIVKWG